MSQPSAPSSGLLSLRTAFVLLLALLAASAAAGLTLVLPPQPGGGSSGRLAGLRAGIRFFDWLIS